MQELTVTATIAVRGGPLWKLSTHLKPQIYEVASLPLGGDAGETVTVLPEAAEASLLAVRAVSAAGAAAKVTVTGWRGHDGFNGRRQRWDSPHCRRKPAGDQRGRHRWLGGGRAGETQGEESGYRTSGGVGAGGLQNLT